MSTEAAKMAVIRRFPRKFAGKCAAGEFCGMFLRHKIPPPTDDSWGQYADFALNPLNRHFLSENTTMTEQYWRMQLHPDDRDNAVKHSTQCLSRGYIGLDFKETVGDLTAGIDRSELPDGQHDYMDFAMPMKVGDFVLIFAHNFPFALVKVTGDYKHITEKERDSIGIWCTHIREIELVCYYADWKRDAHAWSKIEMYSTISKLNDDTKKSYQLINKWRKEYGW